jgi:hypothetical protein
MVAERTACTRPRSAPAAVIFAKRTQTILEPATSYADAARSDSPKNPARATLCSRVTSRAAVAGDPWSVSRPRTRPTPKC